MLRMQIAVPVEHFPRGVQRLALRTPLRVHWECVAPIRAPDSRPRVRE
jgi:hypothetical protein